MDVLNQVKATLKEAIIEAVVSAGLAEASQLPDII
jgi:arginyl-tRNA synthetase